MSLLHDETFILALQEKHIEDTGNSARGYWTEEATCHRIYGALWNGTMNRLASVGMVLPILISFGNQIVVLALKMSETTEGNGNEPLTDSDHFQFQF